MRNICALFFSLFLSANVFAQQYDAQWVAGFFNTSFLDFRVDTVALYTVAPTIGFTETSADICDSDGSLLYFTNGICIFDRNGNKLINGDTISPCAYTNQYYVDGLNIQQAALFLPKPGDNRYYYLIHFSNDTANDERPGKLYYSLIDKEGNSGLGTVIQKNVIFFEGAILRGGGMTACKHANGRDYWVIMGGLNSNLFYKFLLTPNGILGPFIQNIGPVFNGPFDVAYSKFSEDGSKYVTITFASSALILDFDRCTGMLSNPSTIYNNDASGGGANSGGLACFSPSGRFLYATNTIALNQFDLWGGNPQHDSVMVYMASDTDLAQMDMIQLGPNGKLYASTWAGGYFFLHVVNYPDSLGSSCGFVWGGQRTLSLNSICLPNMINYKLGPLVGSACDTLNTATNEIALTERLLRVLPNPADKYVYAEVGTPGDYEMDLLNQMGQLLARKETKQIDIFDTEHLAAGIYFLRIRDRKASDYSLTRKIVIQH